MEREKELYDPMDRSGVKALRRRGKSCRAIAREMGCDRKTVKRMLDSPVEHRYQRSEKSSHVDCYKDSIVGWLRADVTVQRMLELAQEDTERPYKGGRSVFYAKVAEIRSVLELEEGERFVRFEGLPGEYCQIDWGEVRKFPFIRQEACTRYFFAARLKFSRCSYVEFTSDMRLETLIRCMLRAFAYFGGVSWICVFDNMKTVVLRRDEKERPVWNPTFFKFMVEIESHPEACWKNSGNQKGSVENLVGWVKSNFLKGRTFLNDGDLAEQCRCWLERVNGQVSQAHGEIPREVLSKEQEKFTVLCTTAEEYGLLRSVEAGPDMLVHVDRNHYMVPVGMVGRPLVARIRQFRLDFYDGDKLVATYRRRFHKQYRPIQNPEYCESVLREKPRARVMLYRDHLRDQDPSIATFIAELCRRYRGTEVFGPHVLKLYDLWREFGTEELGVACAIASEHEAYGTEYLVSLLRNPRHQEALNALALVGVPAQESIDRSLTYYEAFVEGGESSWSRSA